VEDTLTLGSFNNPAKYSDGLLRLWAAILQRLPRARLLLKAGLFSDASLAENLRSRFQAAGGDASRLETQAGSPRQALLEAYGKIDIALDPFPYSGGVTTLEALWMGVPVVTRPGSSFASRHTTSFLTTAGFPELVAVNEADYVEKVVALAGDAARLATYRSSLRPALQASPICDGTGFARAWQDAILNFVERTNV
jgi:predicted O-linked N-acetylglucosamine transferase (SPINDLY family)